MFLILVVYRVAESKFVLGIFRQDVQSRNVHRFQIGASKFGKPCSSTRLGSNGRASFGFSAFSASSSPLLDAEVVTVDNLGAPYFETPCFNR